MKQSRVILIVLLGIVAVSAVYWLGYRQGRLHAEPAAGPTASPPEVTGPGRDAILQMLPGKTWFTHWETRIRTRPVQFTVTPDGQVRAGESSKNWRLELRWVLNDGEHLFLPTDHYTLDGFYLPTGRQKGYFADKPQ